MTLAKTALPIMLAAACLGTSQVTHAALLDLDFANGGNADIPNGVGGTSETVTVSLDAAGFVGETFDVTLTASTDVPNPSGTARLAIHGNGTRGAGIDSDSDTNLDNANNLFGAGTVFDEQLTISFDNFSDPSLQVSIELLIVGADIGDQDNASSPFQGIDGGDILAYATSSSDSGTIDISDLLADADTDDNSTLFAFDQSSLAVSPSGGSITFTATDGDGLRVRGLRLNIVPEPGSMALMALGTLAVLGRRR